MVIKMLIILNLINRFNAISTNVQASDFENIYKLLLKLTWMAQTCYDSSVLERRNQLGWLILPDFKAWYFGTWCKELKLVLCDISEGGDGLGGRFKRKGIYLLLDLPISFLNPQIYCLVMRMEARKLQD